MGEKDVDYKDPNLSYASDLKANRFFTKNQENFINVLSQEQLPTMGKVFLLDVFLSTGNIVEPHYHSNASELIYGITGETVVSMINPKTNELKNIKIQPQEAVTIPQGWWHYFQASEEDTHVLTIYDTSKLDTVWGSDILRLTPAQVFSHAYCLNEDQVQQTLGSIKDRVIIGPPADCDEQNQANENYNHQNAYYQPYYPTNRYDPRTMPGYYNNPY